MKTTTTSTTKVLALALTLSLVGCTYIVGPVKLAQAFTDAKSQVIDEMSQALKKNANAAGVGDARKVFEAKKADLVAKRSELKGGPQGMNVDWSNELTAMESRHRQQLDSLGVELSVACKESCADAKDSWDKLKKEFNDTVKWNQ